MKKHLAKNIKPGIKKAIWLFGKLNAPGVVGFINVEDDKTRAGIINIASKMHKIRKAGKRSSTFPAQLIHTK